MVSHAYAPAGAIGEISTKGGCLILKNTTPKQLLKQWKGYFKMANFTEDFEKIKQFRTWSDYAKDILDFHSELLMNEEST